MRFVIVAAFMSLTLVRCACEAPPAVADAGQAAVDAGAEADAGPADVDAGPVDAGPPADAGPRCAPTPVEAPAVQSAAALRVEGTRTIVASAAGVQSFTGSGASLALESELIPPPAQGQWLELAISGAKVVAAQRGTGSEVASQNLDDTGDVDTFDIYSYADYETQVDPGANAYIVQSGLVAADATRVYVQEALHGGLIVLDAATLDPLGAFLNLPNDRAVGGAEALFVDGDYVVAVIRRSGIGLDPVFAVRVFDVSDPTNIAITGQADRDQSNSDQAVYDAARDRYLIGSFPQSGNAGIYEVSIDADGLPSTVARIHESVGPQIRGLAIAGDLLIASTPSFGAESSTTATIFDLTTSPLATIAVVDVPALAPPIAASDAFAYLGNSGELHAIPIADCVD